MAGTTITTNNISSSIEPTEIIDLNDNRGICPRAIEDLFKNINYRSSQCKNIKFIVRGSYLQIYNETVSDLLRPDGTCLNIREDKKKGVHVEGISEWNIRNVSDFNRLIERGSCNRRTASTSLNDISSRSHAVFVVFVELSENNNDNFDNNNINFNKFNNLHTHTHTRTYTNTKEKKNKSVKPPRQRPVSAGGSPSLDEWTDASWGPVRLGSAARGRPSSACTSWFTSSKENNNNINNKINNNIT
eukprot:GHVR01127909.1.p1 GENE.GHVR01127909.1~~GHVR01127909.1.p1  ORF type:complete len:245 (-),score=90.41 GHVR01127909.1:195-929(-)